VQRDVDQFDGLGRDDDHEHDLNIPPPKTAIHDVQAGAG
jgi:hypothetical protein